MKLFRKKLTVTIFLVIYFAILLIEANYFIQFYYFNFNRSDSHFTLLLLLAQSIVLAIYIFVSLKEIKYQITIKNSLKESESRYQYLVDVSNDWIWQTDRNGIIIFSNQRVKDIFGYSPSEIIGKSMDELLQTEKKHSFSEALKSMEGTHKPLIGYEYNTINGKGMKVILKRNCGPITDSNGKVGSYWGSYSNITEQKRAESNAKEELEHSKAILEILSKSFDLSYKDLFDFAVEKAEELTRSTFGFIHTVSEDQKDIIFSTFNKNVYRSCNANTVGHHPIEMAGNWTESARQRKPVVYNNYQESTNRKGFPEGHVHINRFMSVPVIEGDKVRLIIGVANKSTDYTENDVANLQIIANELNSVFKRKESEKVIKMLSLAIEQAPVSVVITDTKGLIQYVNPKFSDVSDYSVQEIIGKNPSVLKSGLTNNEAYKQLWNNLNSGIEWRGEFCNRKKNGELYWENVLITPIKDSIGSIINFLAVKEDITENKMVLNELVLNKKRIEEQNREYQILNNELKAALEKAHESEKLKSAFLANLSHEIRTPMNAIVGFSQLLENNEDIPEASKSFIHIIKSSSNYLLGIINNILQISIIESGNLKVSESEGSVSSLLRELVEFYNAKNEMKERKPINLSVNNLLAENQQFILTDFILVRQVLVNLLDNAYKFTAIEETTGEILIGCELNRSIFLTFSVCDNGIGIPNEKQAAIFERFIQNEETHLTRNYGGIGLGLAISKGIIERLGGEIWVESEQGKGAKFYFTIPYKTSGSNVDKQNKNICNSLVKGKNILLVEDTEYNAMLIKEFLSELEINLLIAPNGKNAIEQFEQHPEIDIVLMDIRLPDISGYDLTTQMKAVRKDVIIIAQTAYSSPDNYKRCIEVGCFDVITKPINKEKFHEVLCKSIGLLNHAQY